MARFKSIGSVLDARNKTSVRKSTVITDVNSQPLPLERRPYNEAYPKYQYKGS